MARQYEIHLRHIGKKEPMYVKSAYGFGMNPPIVIDAKSRSAALHKLRLPKCVQVSSMRRH